MLPNPGKGAPMQRCQPERGDAANMLGRRIAAVGFPAIAGIVTRMLGHDPVAGNLGNDRGSGNRPAPGVAGDDCFRRPVPARAGIAVDEDPGGFLRQSRDRAGHRQHAGPVDVELLNLLDRADADANDRDSLQAAENGLPRLQVELLRIVDTRVPSSRRARCQDRRVRQLHAC